jgi:outer membrane protein assembly factor BamE
MPPTGSFRKFLRNAAPGVAVATLLLLAGCSGGQPSRSGLLQPYRADLPQGNYVTRAMVEQVRPGMEREQVRAILGTPLLGHVFHADRWDYAFRFRHSNGRTEQRNVSVRFREGKVTQVIADPLPEREDASDPALPGFKPPR